MEKPLSRGESGKRNHFIKSNIASLRWHYPDQVLGVATCP